ELVKFPRDAALSAATLAGAHVLDDGRVVLDLGGDRGIFYPSRAALEQTIQRGAELAARGPLNLANTLLPPIDDFLGSVELHAAPLGPAIGVPVEALDYTVTSLKTVDEALKRIARSRRKAPDVVPAVVDVMGEPAGKRLTPTIVTPLVAYIGEIMRRASS